MDELTYKELIYRLNYDPETGKFIWRNPTNTRIKPGNLAGNFDNKDYLVIGFNRKLYQGHRLAWFYMTGVHPPDQIDYINGNPSDNRWQNLRLASHNQNHQNESLRKTNTSGEKGVTFHFQTGKWRARVQKNNVRYTSLHNYWWQAVRAVRRRREQLHGEYHRHK